MKSFLKVIGLVAGSVAVCMLMFPLADGSGIDLFGSQNTVGGCSTVGGQSTVGGCSTVGGQSTVGDESNVCPGTDVVSFDSDGGAAVAPLSGPDGSSVRLPSDTYPSYVRFEGWFTASRGGTEVGGAGSSYRIPVGGITLYAQWTARRPNVIAVSPNTGPTKGGTPITITGSGFLAGATVVIGQGAGTAGAIAATHVVVHSATEITAVTGGGATAGVFNVLVTTARGTSTANDAGDEFNYGPIPTVTRVSPNAGPTKGGTPITVTGSGFLAGATMVIGQGTGTAGAIAATHVVVRSSTEITAMTGGDASAGVFNLFVTTAKGTSAANYAGDEFTYDVPPTVAGVSPSAGPVDGGTHITITGSGFVAGATVVIGQGSGTNGAIAATGVTVVSSTEITAVTGGGAKSGAFTLYVTTPGGTSPGNSKSRFTY